MTTPTTPDEQPEADVGAYWDRERSYQRARQAGYRPQPPSQWGTRAGPARLRPPEVGTRSPSRFRAGPAGRPVVDGRRVGAPGWR
jgi:hypothetical protein